MISALWDSPANKDVVEAFMNNKLCIDAAQGKQEAIDAYKKYAVVSRQRRCAVNMPTH